MEALSMNIIQQKRCTKCKAFKSIDNYTIDNSRKDKLQPMCKACRSDFYKKKYENQKEAINRRNNLYAKSNRDVIAVVSANRAAKKHGDSSVLLVKDWREVLALCGEVCLCCGSLDGISLDHIVPLSAGGRNVKENLQPLCMTCNRKKRCKTIDYRKI
jgi:5-methylcytosine-specific restriction endonuclease McrA